MDVDIFESSKVYITKYLMRPLSVNWHTLVVVVRDSTNLPACMQHAAEVYSIVIFLLFSHPPLSLGNYVTNTYIAGSFR